MNVIDPAQLPASFPFQEIQSHVVVPVAFGDEEPQLFMFDTGAGTFILPEAETAHGGTVIGRTQAEAGGGAMVTNDLLTLKSPMTVGGAVRIDNALVNAPWDASGGALWCVAPAGLFGAPAMNHAVWQVDYGTHQINVAATVDQLEHITDAIAVPFTVQQPALSPTPHVTLPIGTGTLEFLVDTGGGIPIIIDPEALKSVGVEVPADAPAVVSSVTGAGGTFESELPFVEVPITFGDSTLDVPIGVGAGFAPGVAGNIGHEFLKNFVVTFDWSTNTMYLDPIAVDGSIAPLPGSPSAAVGWDGQKMVVSTVAKGGPADKAGIKLGATITAVDGPSVEGATIDDYCTIANGKPKTITTDDGTTYDAATGRGFLRQSRRVTGTAAMPRTL